MSLPRSRDDRGAVAIMVAVLASALFLVAALVVDLGLARDTRRQAQNSADASALAAANALFPPSGVCSAGTSTPCFAEAVAAAKDYAAVNYRMSDESWDGCTDGLALTHRPEASAPASNSCISFDSSTAPTQVRVQMPIRTQSTGLGQLANVQSVSLHASAVASVDRGGGGSYAIFAVSDTCGDKTVQMNGDGFRVQGGVHSNDDAKINGNNILIAGPLSTVGSATLDGSVTVSGPRSSGPPVRPDPLGPLGNNEDIANWRPGSPKAVALGSRYHDVGNAEITAATVATRGPGVYYTTNKVSLSGNDVLALDATFVIDNVSEENTVFLVNGNNPQLTFYADPTLNPNKVQVITNAGAMKCDKSSVHLNGNNVQYSGVIYAPRGQVHINGDNATAIRAAIIGLTVLLNGNGPSITNDGDFLVADALLALLR